MYFFLVLDETDKSVNVYTILPENTSLFCICGKGKRREQKTCARRFVDCGYFRRLRKRLRKILRHEKVDFRLFFIVTAHLPRVGNGDTVSHRLRLPVASRRLRFPTAYSGKSGCFSLFLGFLQQPPHQSKAKGLPPAIHRQQALSLASSFFTSKFSLPLGGHFKSAGFKRFPCIFMTFGSNWLRDTAENERF